MDNYVIFKTLHLLGMALFVGNIVVTAWWKLAADRTRQPAVIAFAQVQVARTDWLFTLGGVALLAIGGYGMAGAGGPSLAEPWIVAGQALFVASGVLWAAVLVPLQVRLGRLARGFAGGGEIPARYWRLTRWWNGVGMVATVLPIAAVVVMAAK